MKKLLQLSFIPRSTDFGLLVLRCWVGLTLLLNHGWGKVMNFSQTQQMFSGMDPLGIGATPSAVLVIFAEVIAAAALVVGFATRFAALVITIELAVAFIGVHHHVLAMGPRSGELAFMYLAGVVTILLAGGGRFVVCKTTNDVS
ncbi:MAG: DoxX family protein [Opitutaceae bacterium]|jgi:putative oxidoreductase